VCVEGDSEGPLTGSDRDGKWIWDACIASSSSTGGATGGATGSADDEAAAAMKDSEASVEKLNKGEEAAIKEEEDDRCCKRYTYQNRSFGTTQTRSWVGICCNEGL